MMKKLPLVGLLLLGSMVFATAQALPAGTQTAINSKTSADSQNLQLSSDMLGVRGEFSLSTIYSKTFGLILQGKYAQLLTSTNAIALELDGGKLERRVGVTWGHRLTANQRFKLTAEDLAQKKDFDFDSGKLGKWVSQTAVGGSYQYLLPYKLLKDINLNAYYSKASSYDLGYKDYTQGAIVFRNYRHIAGATDKNASAGIDISPMKTTLIGLQLNYDKIKYNARYEKDNSNVSGLGASISLRQLINKRVQFSLLASDRKPYKDYQAEVDWLLHSAPGSKLQLGLIDERIDGNFGLPNDTRGGIELSYSWGGDATAPATFSDPAPTNDSSDLKDWTNKPAVHMEQVLARRDQLTKRLTPSPVPGPGANSDFYINSQFLQPTVVAEKIGQEIQDMSYGNEPDINTLMFVNTASNTYPVKFSIEYTSFQSGDEPRGLSVKAVAWNKYGPYNYTLKITGIPTKDDFARSTDPNHNINFNIVAERQDTYKTTLKTSFVIKADIPVPDVDLKAKKYFAEFDKPAHIELATITSKDGSAVDQGKFELAPSTIGHNITLDTSECQGKQSCIVYLQSSKVTEAMFDKPENITLKYTNDSGGKAERSFDLSITGKPQIATKDVGSAKIYAGGKIDPVTAKFNNPIDSGAIKSFRLVADGVEDVTATYNVVIDSSGTLSIKEEGLPKNAPIGEKDIKIYATNDIGESESFGVYKLTVVDNKPQITHQRDALFQADDTGKTSPVVVSIKSPAGELDFDSIQIKTADEYQDPLQYYNLKAQIKKVDNQTAEIRITTAGSVSQVGCSKYTVSAASKGGNTATLPYAFRVQVLRPSAR